MLHSLIRFPSPSRGLFFILKANVYKIGPNGRFPSPTLGLHLKSCFYKAICRKAAHRTLRRSPNSDSFTKDLTHKKLLKPAPQAERRKSIKLLLQRRAHRAHPQRSFNTNATIISIVAKHSNYSITHQIILHA